MGLFEIREKWVMDVLLGELLGTVIIGTGGKQDKGHSETIDARNSNLEKRSG